SHGADTLRLYEMFMGPLDADVAWSTTGLDGARRFLDRVWRLFVNGEGEIADHIVKVGDESIEKVYHETVKKVTRDFENLHFNTGISQLMVFINEGYKANTISKEFVEGFVKLLYPIAPHITEELWHRLGYNHTITYESWPKYDEEKLVDQEIEIAIQVMGKVRAKIKVAQDISKDDLEAEALSNSKVQPWLEGKTVRKVI